MPSRSLIQDQQLQVAAPKLAEWLLMRTGMHLFKLRSCTAHIGNSEDGGERRARIQRDYGQRKEVQYVGQKPGALIMAYLMIAVPRAIKLSNTWPFQGRRSIDGSDGRLPLVLTAVDGKMAPRQAMRGRERGPCVCFACTHSQQSDNRRGRVQEGEEGSGMHVMKR